MTQQLEQPAAKGPSEAPPVPTPEAATVAVPTRRRARLRRWLAAKTDSPAAVPLMSFLSFTDACISPVMPEVMLVPMCLSRPERRWRYAFAASLASVLGGLLGYLLGMTLWDAGLDRIFFDYIPGFTPELFADASARFGHSAFVVVFLAGFTPLPYKLFTIAAGVCHADVAIESFIAASVTSRFLRFYLEIWLIHRFGPPVLAFLVRRLGLILILMSLAALGVVIWYELARD